MTSQKSEAEPEPAGSLLFVSYSDEDEPVQAAQPLTSSPSTSIAQPPDHTTPPHNAVSAARILSWPQPPRLPPPTPLAPTQPSLYHLTSSEARGSPSSDSAATFHSRPQQHHAQPSPFWAYSQPQSQQQHLYYQQHEYWWNRTTTLNPFAESERVLPPPFLPSPQQQQQLAGPSLPQYTPYDPSPYALPLYTDARREISLARPANEEGEEADQLAAEGDTRGAPRRRTSSEVKDGQEVKSEATTPGSAVGPSHSRGVARGDAYQIDTLADVKPFVTKLRFMLTNPAEFQDVVTWDATGTGVMVQMDSERLKSEVLPRVYAHSNPQSFNRQFSVYSFSVRRPSLEAPINFPSTHPLAQSPLNGQSGWKVFQHSSVASSDCGSALFTRDTMRDLLSLRQVAPKPSKGVKKKAKKDDETKGEEAEAKSQVGFPAEGSSRASESRAERERQTVGEEDLSDDDGFMASGVSVQSGL